MNKASENRMQLIFLQDAAGDWTTRGTESPWVAFRTKLFTSRAEIAAFKAAKSV